MSKRPDWDEYFLNIMRDVAKRSTCNRGKPGCVFVKDNIILVTGYAGSPPGFPHCLDVGDQMEERVQFIDNNSRDVICVSDVVGFLYNDKKERWEKPATQHCIRTMHGEMNGIIQAAKQGISLDGSTLYVSFTPCRNCAMALISVGVKRILCDCKYQTSSESEEMFAYANIQLDFIKDEVIEYSTKV